MRGALPRHVSPVAHARATIVAAVGVLLLACSVPGFLAQTAFAQNVQDVGTQFNVFAGAAISPDEKMLVESDQMVYDYDNNQVAAVGNVKIYYAGYTLEAEKVTYNKGNGRLIATGNVKLVDPSGATFYSEYFDITDDFRDGFVQSLRVDTVERTHFAAERAERTGGETTTFVNGVYTACEPCKDHPEKPPLWNVKAAKIVVNHKEQMVYFTDARLEFFGLPMAYLPYFAIADPSVRRKTGFLSPNFGYSQRVGGFLTVPYFWALAPNYDVTVSPTVFSRQGLLADVEFRHRLENGQYSLRGAAIYQLDPLAFAGSPGEKRIRGGVRTTGEFALNQDWTLGWDGTLSTDRMFTRDYGVLNKDGSETISTINLTGLRDRNYFEARASYYQILTDPAAGPQYDQNRQGFVVPVVDYHRVSDNEVLGGEVAFTSNVANVVRGADNDFTAGGTFYHGTAGDTVRVTKAIEWQRRIVGPMGQVITPFASLRGDGFFMTGQTAAATSAGLDPNTAAYRFMPAVGVEWSLPVLATNGSATHIIEPMAQIIVRPNEMGAGTLPNNDAQSLVFDVSNLFDRDKFSGFDRVEGGTRANLGVRYNGTFANGASVDASFGQSIQLAGINSFATDPVSNVGAYSGLDTTFSDYVAGVGVDTGTGPRFTARGRFDDQNFNLNRAEVAATTAFGPMTASASYLYLRNNPSNGLLKPAQALRGAGSINLAENWRAFGTMTYDVSGASLASDSFGVAFDNECLTLSVAYSEIYSSDQPTRWLNFRLALRTFGETSVNSNLTKLSN
jgi:LPS-assembly protein